MKRLFVFLALGWAMVFSLNAQEEKQEEKQEEVKKEVTPFDQLWKLDLGLTGIGVSADLPISSKVLLDAAIGLGPAYTICNSEYTVNYDFLNPAVYINLSGNWYYNRAKRESQGKSVLRNSGNFVGLTLRPVSRGLIDQDEYSLVLLTNVHWGIKRALGKHWLFKVKIGAGYAHDFDFESGMLYPTMDVKFSYVFPGKN